MTAEQFTYWLQGYSEIAGDCPTSEQWQVIQDHLVTVFEKVTPYRGGYAFDPNGAGGIHQPGATPFMPQPSRTIC